MATATEPKARWRTRNAPPSGHPDRPDVRANKLHARGVPYATAQAAALFIEKDIQRGDPLALRASHPDPHHHGVWAILAASNMMDLRRGLRPSGSIFDVDVQVWMMCQGRFFYNHCLAVKLAGRARKLP